MKMAVIPARGGSKRIPRKNIKDFCGKPMIAYAICAAKESGLFDRIVVSTDDDEIAKIANQWGAETPFKRPIELSDDYTATVPVIKHSIETFINQGWHIQEVCCIYPCVPFLHAMDLICGFDQMKQTSNGFSLSITEYPSTIQRALKKLSNEKLEPFSSEFETVRTQDLNAAYYDAGQFYWLEKSCILKDKKIFTDNSGVVVLDVQTGEILALANWPTYNPNVRSGLSGEQLRNRVLTDTFEPGSTMKPFSVAIALEKGLVQPNTQMQIGKQIVIGKKAITDTHAYGALTVAEVIQNYV